MVHKRSKESDKTLEVKITKFTQYCSSILSQIDEAIMNESDCVDKLQLARIKNEVIQMKKVLSSDVFMPTYSRMIVDQWDHSFKLGEELLEIFDLYLEL